MTRSRTLLLCVALLPVLVLSACGDGWEMIEVRGEVPYTMERTAGPGVKYVRAYMLPEKGPVLEPKPPITAPVDIPSKEKLKDAQPLFQGQQLKK